MTTLVKVGIGAALVAGAVGAIPALKGPWNRFKNNATEILDAEYVVDNYKAEYVKLHAKKVEVKSNIEKFTVEKRVVEKKLAYANSNVEAAKAKLKSIDASNLVEFNRAKDAYESFKVELSNLVAMKNVYSNALVKLDASLALIETNMRKAKANVDTLSSKKMLVDSIKGVNDTIASLQGVGEDSSTSIAVEKLDDAALRESIKLEALSENNSYSIQIRSEADAKAYLETVK